jgi:C-terminal processing protease CtpA/Prc
MSGEPFTVIFKAQKLGLRVADSRPPVIQTFTDVDGERGSAECSGLIGIGDVITHVNDTYCETQQDTVDAFIASGRPVTLTLRRAPPGTRAKSVEVGFGAGPLGIRLEKRILSASHARMVSHMPGDDVAEVCGFTSRLGTKGQAESSKRLHIGDVVTGVNGLPFTSYHDVLKAVEKAPRPLRLSVTRTEQAVAQLAAAQARMQQEMAEPGAMQYWDMAKQGYALQCSTRIQQQ